MPPLGILLHCLRSRQLSAEGCILLYFPDAVGKISVPETTRNLSRTTPSGVGPGQDPVVRGPSRNDPRKPSKVLQNEKGGGPKKCLKRNHNAFKF